MYKSDISLPNGTLLSGNSFTYRIQQVLGQGFFGITYLATVEMRGALGTLSSNMQVAIKEFFMKEVNGRNGTTVTSGSQGGLVEDYKRKFRREARNLAKLDHPHIVKVLEAFDANDTAYYVMEHIDGMSLDTAISLNNGLDESRSIGLMKQICSAVSFMHENNMLHLDIKPNNIMLRKNGEAVLIDFGLSKQYDESGRPESSTKVESGTPGYAPVEQMNYHEGKGFPVTMDVYALGGTLFKMLTGCRPPDASDVLNDGFPYGELKQRNVSDATIQVIQHAMMPIKKERIQSVIELTYALNCCSMLGRNNLQSKDFEGVAADATTPKTVIDDTPVNDFEHSYGISIFTIDFEEKKLHIYYRGRTYVEAGYLFWDISKRSDLSPKLFSDLEESISVNQERTQLTQSVEEYVANNKQLLTESYYNIITFCDAYSYWKALEIIKEHPELSCKSGNSRLIQEMQLIPLSHNRIAEEYEEGEVYCFHYQDLFCEAELGSGVAEILRIGRENEREKLGSSVEKVNHIWLRQSEGLAHIAISAIIQCRNIRGEWRDQEVLLTAYPFSITVDGTPLTSSGFLIPCLNSIAVVDKNRVLVVEIEGRRVIISLLKLLGYYPKEMEIKVQVGFSMDDVSFILKDKANGNEATLSLIDAAFLPEITGGDRGFQP